MAGETKAGVTPRWISERAVSRQLEISRPAVRRLAARRLITVRRGVPGVTADKFCALSVRRLAERLVVEADPAAAGQSGVDTD